MSFFGLERHLDFGKGTSFVKGKGPSTQLLAKSACDVHFEEVILSILSSFLFILKLL